MKIFNRITLLTPESVELEFTLGGIGSRAWALLIDYHVLAAILIGFLIIWGNLGNQLIDIFSDIGVKNVGQWVSAIALLFMFFLYSGYFVFFETIWQGQTLGKRWAKIRVIRDDGRPIGLQQATLRALLRPIDDTFFLGAFMIIFSSREKRLGDWAAGTLVVQTQAPTDAAEFAISEAAKSLSQELHTIANISAILPDDFAVIREYLQRRQNMSIKAKQDLSLRLAKEMKAIIALEKLPEAVKPDTFLEAVYLAYQQGNKNHRIN